MILECAISAIKKKYSIKRARSDQKCIIYVLKISIVYCVLVVTIVFWRLRRLPGYRLKQSERRYGKYLKTKLGCTCIAAIPAYAGHICRCMRCSLRHFKED